MFVQQGIHVAAALRCVLETIELVETLEAAVGTLHFFNQVASCRTFSVFWVIRCLHDARNGCRDDGDDNENGNDNDDADDNGGDNEEKKIIQSYVS